MRKIWNRGFTPTAVQGYDSFVATRVAQLMDYFEKQGGKALDLAHWISLFQFDFMGDLVFGGGFELMKSGGDSDGSWAVEHEATVAASCLSHLPWVAPFLRIIPLGERTVRFVQFGKDCVRRRLSKGCIKKDLIYYLSGEDKPDVAERTPLKQLLLDGPSAIQAASETTSAIISGVLYYALCHPEVYKRLQTEIDTFTDVGGYGKLAELPYLNACLQETLRLMPANPSLIQRTSPKGQGGTVVSGCVIPEETHVLLPPYVLHRQPQYFHPHPEDFWPDRWLIAAALETGSVPPPDFVHYRQAFIPFGMGPQGCVGKPLAYRETRAVVTKMMQTYEMRFADGYDPERYLSELRDDVLWTKSELPVVLRRRRV